ncbi:unnamed protein product [Acanthoscelides obtectus]|uniref:DDE Tnp4 domain-containing protein n=1 Tax=Acanthoscelides obtectus TaxID=200917 RepID=A0A9P0JZ33_ACAOB|nr:unnamed protein product [Acanthoscelides obtectus]CAK1654100.1 Zinc finger BED domain-containing protein 5 [Acanthoscelides obtectus]
MAYLADFFTEINSLNISLQGNETNILTLQDKIASFLRKLELYQRRVQAGDVSMFTQLSEQLVNNKQEKISFENSVVQHLTAVIDSLQQYFPNMDSRESYSWILRPFSTCVDIFKDEDVSAKVEFLGLRENNSLKVDFQNDKLSTFWRKAAAEYPIIADRALKMLIPFATTYRCETVSTTTISRIVPEVCSVLFEELCHFIQVPTVPNGWKKIANYCNNLWNFPMCLGSMDGKHIVIQSPKFSGSCQGRISDGGVFKNSGFAKALDKSMLNFPQPTILPGRQKPVPYVLVADDAFPLSENILKPFAGNQDRGSRQRIFNYRLSRARRVVENAFGILASVFRCLRKPMLLEPEKVEKITMACVTLHNFLRRNAQAKDLYTPPGSFDAEDLELGTLTEGAWRKDSEVLQSFLPIKKVARKSSYIAKEIRDEFSEYFVSEIGQDPME